MQSMMAQPHPMPHPGAMYMPPMGMPPLGAPYGMHPPPMFPPAMPLMQ